MKSKIISKQSIFNTLNVGASTPLSTLNNRFNPATDYVELHILNESGNLIKSHADYQRYSLSKSTGFVDGSYQAIDHSPIDDLLYYGYVSGTYTLYYNFFRKIFSSSLTKSFFVKEISSSRKELRLASNTLTSDEIQLNFNRIQTKLLTLEYVYNLVLNFGSNVISQVINVSLDTSENDYSILVKLDDPLDASINVNSIGWLLESVSLSTVYNIDLVNEIETDDSIKIQGPNFSIAVDESNSYNTNFVTSSELNSSVSGSIFSSLGFNASFNDSFENVLTQTYYYQQLLGEYLENNSSARINVDYTDYKNYIHFSSAEDRLNNFIYKVKQIEELDSTIVTLKALPDSNKVRIEIDNTVSEKFNIIKLFDGYEYFLYFDFDEHAYPKVDGDLPVVLYSTNSAQFLIWYNNRLNAAKEYDKYNPDYIWKLLPQYIIEDSDNSNLNLFINGLGHYYDNIWICIKSLENIYNSTNNLKTGISKDIVKDMLVSFGIKLYNSSEEVSINQDVFGNNNGTLGLTNFDIIATQDYTKEIYKRIYHNLPILLKSKGTEKSIRTLLSIFGIPSDVLTVDNRWSAFPTNNPVTINKTSLATNLGKYGRIGIPLQDPISGIKPDVIEFTFKASSSGYVYISNSSEIKLYFTSANSYNEVAFEFSFGLGSTDISGLKRASDDTYKIILNYDYTIETVDIHLITREWSDSLQYETVNWSTYSGVELQLGDVTRPDIIQFNNFRLYANKLSDDVLQAHIENVDSIIGTDKDDLICNLPLGSDNKFSRVYLSLVPDNVNPTYSNVLSYYYPSRTEYIPYQNVGWDNDKLMFSIIPNTVNGLNRAYWITYDGSIFNDTSHDAFNLLYSNIEVSTKTKNYVSVDSIDTNENSILNSDIKQNTFGTQESILNVSLSRGKDLNKNMIDFFYGRDINSNFANPGDMYLDEYSGVVKLRNDYFTHNDIEYSYADYSDLAGHINSSLFKMIQDFSPVGTNVITGVSVEPALTDRSKYRYIKSLNALNAIIEIEIGTVNVSSDYVDTFDIVFDQTGMFLSVGDNKYINKPVVDEYEFNRSLDNVLYGNIYQNTVYKYGNNTVNGYKLYKITNPGFFGVWVTVTSFPNTSPTKIEIGGNRTRYVCSSTYPVQNKPRVILGLPDSLVEIEVINRYNCAMVEPEPQAPSEIEFQEYNVDLKSFTLPRYEGSKIHSKKVNTWSEGDSSYGKTAVVDSYVNHTALFTRIYSGSIGNQYNNVTVKYLVDNKGNVIELNELNRNIFDVQNIIKQKDTCTVSLFDPLQHGNQKSTNGVKPVYSSGYFYKPTIYVSDTDTKVEFVKETDSQLSRFEADITGGFIKSPAYSAEVSKYPAYLDGNEYYIYNTYDKITYNSFNSFTSGSISNKTFPSYEVIESSASYQFKATLGMMVMFNPENVNTQTQYRLDIVKSSTNEQSFSDVVLASELLTMHPEYNVTPTDILEGTKYKSHWYFGLQLNLDYPIYDRINNKILPTGVYSNFRINSEELFDPETSWYGDDYWLYFIVFDNRWYLTGVQKKRENTFVGNRTELTLTTLSLRLITLSTQILTDLVAGDHVYFRYARLDANPIVYDFISGGKASVEVSANATLQTTTNIISEIINTNQIIFSTGFSKYYRYTQSSKNSVMIDKYGFIDDPFIVSPYDVISITHPDSTKSYLYNVVSATINSNGLLMITVDDNIAMNVINEPNNFTEFVIFKRVPDETNIVLQFNKRQGDTSPGLLIPSNINPDYMNNIDTIIKGIKEKLITQN